MDWVVLRRRLIEMRNAINSLITSTAPPRAVTNLSATAKAGGVIVLFTRTNGTSYVVYANDTPAIDGAARIDIGNKGEYVDDVGKSGVTRYYWVRAMRGNVESTLAGPVSAITLALNAEITPPTRPPAVDEYVYSDEVGYPVEQ